MSQSYVRLVMNYNGTAADFKSQCNLDPGALPAVNNAVDFFSGLAGGNNLGALLSWHVGATRATGTLTFSSTGPTNSQTCTIANVTFTAVTSGATGNQFNISATPATVAANLVAAINASASVNTIVVASNLLGVVTITAVTPGQLGNGLQLSAGTLSNVVAVGMAGAVNGTAYSQDLR